MTAPAPPNRVAVLVRYTGRVQGVGFRATAAHHARGFGVTGWVTNRADGSVELLAEGPRSAVDGLLAAVRGRFAGHVQAEDADWRPAGGQYQSFDVV